MCSELRRHSVVRHSWVSNGQFLAPPLVKRTGPTVTHINFKSRTQQSSAKCWKHNQVVWGSCYWWRWITQNWPVDGSIDCMSCVHDLANLAGNWSKNKYHLKKVSLFIKMLIYHTLVKAMHTLITMESLLDCLNWPLGFSSESFWDSFSTLHSQYCFSSSH